MMDAGHALVGSAVLAWVMLVVAMFLRSQGWTPAGMRLALGNLAGITVSLLGLVRMAAAAL